MWRTFKNDADLAAATTTTPGASKTPSPTSEQRPESPATPEKVRTKGNVMQKVNPEAVPWEAQGAPASNGGEPAKKFSGEKPKSTFNGAMFDMSQRKERTAPERPSTEGIEYPRAASWANGNISNVMNDDKGRQLFRVFLFDALAEENMNFIEAVDKLKKMKGSDEKKAYAKEIVDVYSAYVNLSNVAMQKIKAAASQENPDAAEFALACKEISRLLENDQFPRFRRSDVYLQFLEALLPRSYAEKWATSFEALLGNHVGRHHFRLFLRSIHAEENLRFWEAVVEFRAMKNKSQAMANLGRVIYNTYLVEGNTNEVYLPFGVRQLIDRRLTEGDVDIALFDEAIKHVEQVLRNDPYVRFLQSEEYTGLLAKLKN